MIEKVGEESLTVEQMSECVSIAAGLIAVYHTMHLHTMGYALGSSESPLESRVSFCYTAFSTDPMLAFFWQSKSYAIHSRFLRQYPNVVLSACNDNEPPNIGNGRGISIYSRANELSDYKSVSTAQGVLGRRSRQGTTRTQENFLLDDSEDRLYQAIPYRVEINSPWDERQSVTVSLNGLRQALTNTEFGDPDRC